MSSPYVPVLSPRWERKEGEAESPVPLPTRLAPLATSTHPDSSGVISRAYKRRDSYHFGDPKRLRSCVPEGRLVESRTAGKRPGYCTGPFDELPLTTPGFLSALGFPLLFSPPAISSPDAPEGSTQLAVHAQNGRAASVLSESPIRLGRGLSSPHLHWDFFSSVLFYLSSN